MGKIYTPNHSVLHHYQDHNAIEFYAENHDEPKIMEKKFFQNLPNNSAEPCRHKISSKQLAPFLRWLPEIEGNDILQEGANDFVYHVAPNILSKSLYLAPFMR